MRVLLIPVCGPPVGVPPPVAFLAFNVGLYGDRTCVPKDWRGGELSPAATRATLLLPHPLGRRTGENCLSKLRRVVVTV